MPGSGPRTAFVERLECRVLRAWKSVRLHVIKYNPVSFGQTGLLVIKRTGEPRRFWASFLDWASVLTSGLPFGFKSPLEMTRADQRRRSLWTKRPCCVDETRDPAREPSSLVLMMVMMGRSRLRDEVMNILANVAEEANGHLFRSEGLGCYI